MKKYQNRPILGVRSDTCKLKETTVGGKDYKQSCTNSFPGFLFFSSPGEKKRDPGNEVKSCNTKYGVHTSCENAIYASR